MDATPQAPPCKLPTEMWCAIATWLTQPGDIAAFMRTCSFFATIARPSLYTRLVWSHDKFAASSALLMHEPALVQRVRRLELDGLAFGPETQGDAMMHASPSDPIRALRNVVDLLPHMTGVTTMVLSRVHLPQNFYYDIAALPALSSLSLRGCHLAGAAPRMNSGLGLRTLRITGLRWTHHTESARDSVASLACAPNLQRLDVDGTLAPAVFNLMSSYALELGSALVLRDLLTESRTDEPGDFVFLSNFLTNTPSIERLYLRRVPKSVALSPLALPNLRAYAGPVHSIDAFTVGRPVTHVRILDQLPAARHHQNALLTMLGNNPNAAAAAGLGGAAMPWPGPPGGALPVVPQQNAGQPQQNILNLTVANVLAGAGAGAVPGMNIQLQQAFQQNQQNFLWMQHPPAAAVNAHANNIAVVPVVHNQLAHAVAVAGGAHANGFFHNAHTMTTNVLNPAAPALAANANGNPNLQQNPGPTGPSWPEIVSVLELLKGRGPPLERLEFRVATYDREMLYMMVALFPDIQDLRITWRDERKRPGSRGGDSAASSSDLDADERGSSPSASSPSPDMPYKYGMDDDFMVDFASQFLREFKELQVLHLYCEGSRARGVPQQPMLQTQTQIPRRGPGDQATGEVDSVELRDVSDSAAVARARTRMPRRRFTRTDGPATSPSSSSSVAPTTRLASPSPPPPNHPPPDVVDRETRGLLGLWEKLHGNLSEVALASDTVWTKWGPRDWVADGMHGRTSFFDEV